MKLAIAAILLASSLYEQEATPQKSQMATSRYVSKNYSALLGMPGFSDALLKLHFELYQGYVKNTNLLTDKLNALSAQDTLELGALKRRFNWEFNGMRLHELYFDNLGGKTPLDTNSDLYRQIVSDFGSYEKWKQNFISTGMIRGIGWVILYRDPQTGRLMNIWIEEHDLGHLAGATPLLIMDVFEHAYITQYGLDRAKYIDAFFKNIRWEEVVRRYPQLVKSS
jgi:Fe-Mn family superoxide dismutase